MGQDIPGTIMFDGGQAQKGYALNRMCYSFNSGANRAAFLEDEAVVDKVLAPRTKPGPEADAIT